MNLLFARFVLVHGVLQGIRITVHQRYYSIVSICWRHKNVIKKPRYTEVSGAGSVVLFCISYFSRCRTLQAYAASKCMRRPR